LIDFEKYTSGKYAYLSTNSTNHNLEVKPSGSNNTHTGDCEALVNQLRLEGKATDVLKLTSLYPSVSLAENTFAQPDSSEVSTLTPADPINAPQSTSPAGRKPSLQAEHSALRIAIAKFLGVEDSVIIAEWEGVLRRLGNGPQSNYFSPALGFRLLTDIGEVFKVVFRNNFDMRAALRHQHLLEKCLATEGNCSPEIIFQSLDNFRATYLGNQQDLEAC